MILKLILAGILLISCHTAHAETRLTCPSIESVRQLQGVWHSNSLWLPLYVTNDELASVADIKKFSKTTRRFKKAEWSGHFLEMAHCFYEGSDNIMLARDMLKPILNSPWHFDAARNLAYCESSNENDCPYGRES